METLTNLVSFMRSAESGSFSGAARRMGLTPSAVSRNVSMLERNIGIRLFQRSSRSLRLTEDGDRFLASISSGVEAVQAAIANVAAQSGKPAGTLKLSVAPTFGVDHILPLLPSFMERHPDVRFDLGFESRQVDLIGEGFDAAIGGGMELTPGVVARRLTPLHVVAVASPAYLGNRALPQHPHELAALDGISMRSPQTGRLRVWTMRNRQGVETRLEHQARIVANDPEAICRAALMGLGIAMIAMPYVERHLDSGALLRLLPHWYSDLGDISLYYSSRTLLPAKTRVFVDYMLTTFRDLDLARRFSAQR